MKHNFLIPWQEQQERNLMTPLDRWVANNTNCLIVITLCAVTIILTLGAY